MNQVEKRYLYFFIVGLSFLVYGIWAFHFLANIYGDIVTLLFSIVFIFPAIPFFGVLFLGIVLLVSADVIRVLYIDL